MEVCLWSFAATNSCEHHRIGRDGRSQTAQLTSSRTAKMVSDQLIVHYDQHKGKEVETPGLVSGRQNNRGHHRRALPARNNLIEDTIRRLFELRGISVPRTFVSH